MSGRHWLILTARVASWCVHAALAFALLVLTVTTIDTDKPKAIFWGLVFLLAVIPMIPSMIRWRRMHSWSRAVTVDVNALAASLACVCAVGSLGSVIYALVREHPYPDYALGYWLLGIALLWVTTICFELAPSRPEAHEVKVGND